MTRFSCCLEEEQKDIMVKHLEHDYELEYPEVTFVSHFWDTIAAMGGWKGLVLLTVGIFAFYQYVLYTITNGREKREAKKRLAKGD